MIDPNLVIAAGTQIAELLNKAIDEAKIKRENDIFKFKELYNAEKIRPDRDHDDLVKWNLTKRLLVETIMEKIRPSGT